MPPKILRIKDLAQRYGCCERTIQRYHAEGIIPPGHYLPKKHWPFWFEAEIAANEASRRKRFVASDRTPRTLNHHLTKGPELVPATQFSFKL